MSELSLFQSPQWEKFKLATGYDQSYRVEGILVLQKKLPLGYTMLYSPMVHQSQLTKLDFKRLAREIAKIARANKSIFYRFELDLPQSDTSFISKLSSAHFTKSFEEMQPEHNWLLNLNKTPDELLTQMKQKGRYNIKLAQKSGIKITSSNELGKELNAFYSHYSETGRRHKISYRNKKYFDSLIEIFGPKEYARVYTAWKSKEPLASAVMLYFNKEALYLYGGSSEKMRNLMAPYFLQWQMILDAKDKGCKKYNFLGVAPNDSPEHPWAGLTRFKKRFGGYQYDIVGCYDLPTKPLLYRIFKLIEQIRR